MARTHKWIFKVIVVGDAAVGKTSLMFRFVHGTFAKDYKMTIGVNFATKMVNLDGTKVKLSIWDTAGQERFHFLLPSYYDGSSGCLTVFDVTRRESFTNLPKWLDQVRSKCGNHIPILLIGNKADLDDLRAVTMEEAAQFATQNGVLYQETSAKTGTNVTDVFVYLTRTMTSQA